MALSTIVPFHAGYYLNASEFKKYMDIAPSRLFSKCLDKYILIMQLDSFQSDPLLFECKENASIVQCASVILMTMLIMIVVFT